MDSAQNQGLPNLGLRPPAPCWQQARNSVSYSVVRGAERGPSAIRSSIAPSATAAGLKADPIFNIETASDLQDGLPPQRASSRRWIGRMDWLRHRRFGLHLKPGFGG